MIIEPAKESDLAEIELLTKKEFPYTKQNMAYSRFKKKNVRYYVAKIKDDLLGFIDIETNGNLKGIAVKKEYRNQGVGSSLLDYAINKFREWKLKRIELIVKTDNLSAEHIYRKKGFVYLKDLNHKVDGHDAAILELKL